MGARRAAIVLAIFAILGVMSNPAAAQNLVSNGSFNSSISGWSAADSSYASYVTWSSQDANGSVASGSLKLSASAATTAIYARSSLITVSPNVSYTLTIAINDQTTVFNGNGAFVSAVVYDGLGGYLASYDLGSAQKAVWKTLSTTFTTPAQAASILLAPRIIYGGGSGFGLFDNASLTSNAVTPSATFTASPSAISAGGSSTLSWTTTNATSVSIDHGIGAQALSGSIVVTPGSTTTYTLTASGAGGTRTATATVTVNTPGIPQVTFTASPSAIAAGGASTLAWSTTNATAVSIDHSIGVKSANGSAQVSPQETTTYTLTATGAGGTRTATATVTVVPPPTIVFTATPAAVLPGASVKLEWQVFDASLVVIDPDLGAQPLSGFVIVTPKVTTIYMLTATGVGGVRAMPVTVTVGGRRRAARH